MPYPQGSTFSFDSPDPSSDSETEGYHDGYEDSDDASESAYGDTPVPPDPSSDSETEGYQDGYDDSDDASESAYGDTPVPGPSGAGPAGPTRSDDARFFQGHEFQDGGRRMFNPRAVDDDQNTDNLNDEQVSSLQNYFDEFIPDDVVEQSILSEVPVRELIFLKTRKVDQDVLALLPEPTQKPVKLADLDYQLISCRNEFTLGLLCKLWGKLAAARADPETFDVDSALTLVEQTVSNPPNHRVPEKTSGTGPYNLGQTKVSWYSN